MISVFTAAELIRATAAAYVRPRACGRACARLSERRLMAAGLRLQFPSHPDVSEAVNQ